MNDHSDLLDDEQQPEYSPENEPPAGPEAAPEPDIPDWTLAQVLSRLAARPAATMALLWRVLVRDNPRRMPSAGYVEIAEPEEEWAEDEIQSPQLVLDIPAISAPQSRMADVGRLDSAVRAGGCPVDPGRNGAAQRSA